MIMAIQHLPDHPFNSVLNRGKKFLIAWIMTDGYISNSSFNETRTKAIRWQWSVMNIYKGIGIVEFECSCPNRPGNN